MNFIQASNPIFTADELIKIDQLWDDNYIVHKKFFNREYTSSNRTPFKNDAPLWVMERLLKWYEKTTNEKFKTYNLELILHRFEVGHYFAKHRDSDYRKKGFRDILLGMSINDEYQGGEFNVYKENSASRVGKLPGVPYIFKTDTLHEVKPVISGTRKSILVFLYDEDFVGKEKELKLL